MGERKSRGRFGLEPSVKGGKRCPRVRLRRSSQSSEVGSGVVWCHRGQEQTGLGEARRRLRAQRRAQEPGLIPPAPAEVREPFVKPGLAAHLPPSLLLPVPPPSPGRCPWPPAGRRPVRPRVYELCLAFPTTSRLPCSCQPPVLMCLQPPPKASAALSALIMVPRPPNPFPEVQEPHVAPFCSVHPVSMGN